MRSKIEHYDEALGGIGRLSFQMSVAGLLNDRLTDSVVVLGSEVAPRIRLTQTS